MKITKKEFISAIVNNHSAFVGVTKYLFNHADLINHVQEWNKNRNLMEWRTAIARSNSIKFSGDSILGFDQIGKYSFYLYEYAEGKIYICLHTWTDDFDGKTFEKAMYYFI